MLFTEPTFLFAFLPLSLALHAVPGARYRNWLLLVASVAFYASGGGSFTWLMLTSIAVNYGAALWIDRLEGRRARVAVLAWTVTANLVVLGFFKYAGFVVENVNAVGVALGASPRALPSVALPIGISFFTFHAISYVVDVYCRDAVAQKGPVETALYLLLFPQLIAGPIIRYRDIATQLASRVTTIADAAEGIRRFVLGFGKKMLIANLVAGPADRIFAMPASELTAALAWLGVVCYSLQIYFDFSGYSDMAIGLARLFGFRFPENFDYPYVSQSIQEFWRRWHLSLSTWFRDYLYVPLGGNRVPPVRLYANLVLVFFLCGLWHGASWTFVVWGLFHGGFLVLERLGLARWVAAAPRPVRHVYALVVAMVGWVFFRADSVSAAMGMLRAMVGLGPGLPTAFAVSWYLTPEVLVALGAGIVGSTPVWPVLAARWGQRQPDGGASLGALPSALATAGLAAVFLAGVMLVAAHTYNPFIYFRF